jgi:hypothetical protein
MGRWSQSALRGGGGLPAAPVLQPAPTIDYISAIPGIAFTDVPFVPDLWRLENSPDGSTAWTTFTVVLGTEIEIDVPNDGTFWRAVGTDLADNPTTEFSNIVQSTP